MKACPGGRLRAGWVQAALWRRVRRACMAFGVAGLGLLGGASWAQNGVPPRRVVSLLPSLSETVCALGACDRLVGVDRYSNHPSRLRALPQLGGGLDPNVEAIVALRPDLVLVSASSRVAERLQALGLRVLVLEPKTRADVRVVLGQVAQALGLPDAQAQALWAEIVAGERRAAQTLRPALRGQRVYFEVNAGPYAAGPGSFIGELLSQLGLANVVPAALGPFPRLSPEFVVQADPDVVMVSALDAPALAQRPGWAQLRAQRNARVCVFAPAQHDVLVRPGPRLAEAARLMVDCVNAAPPRP